MALFKSFFVMLAALQSSAIASEQPAQDMTQDRIDQVVQSHLDKGRLTCLSLAMHLGGDELVADGWGRSGKSDCNPDTSFAAPALTEAFTAAAVLHLVREERIALDDELSKHLPGFTWKGEQVTVRHILTHSSGISPFGQTLGFSDEPPAEKDDPLGAWIGKIERLQRFGPMLGRLVRTPLEFSPGECQSYSDSNVLVAGVLVEAVSGKELAAYLSDNFFDPLGLDGTHFKGKSPGCASIDVEVSGAQRAIEAGFQPLGGPRLRTTATDLAIWQRALIDNTQLEAAQTVAMRNPGRLTNGTEMTFGYGWNVTPMQGQKGFSYGGTAGGSSVHVAWYPELDLTVVLLAEGSLRLAGLEREITREVFDLPSPHIVDRPLTEERLAPYMGVYQIGCTRLQIDAEDGHLVLETSEYGRQRLLYQGGRLFVAEADHQVRLTFDFEDGVVRSFLLDDYGVQSIAVRWDS